MDISISKFLAPYCDGRPGFCVFPNDMSHLNQPMLETLQRLNETAGVNKIVSILRDNLFGKGLSADRIEVFHEDSKNNTIITHTWYAFNREMPKYRQSMILKGMVWRYDAGDETLVRKEYGREFLSGTCTLTSCDMRFRDWKTTLSNELLKIKSGTRDNNTIFEMTHFRNVTERQIAQVLKMGPSTLNAYLDLHKDHPAALGKLNVMLGIFSIIMIVLFFRK